MQANESFRMGRIKSEQIGPEQYTLTGHLDNHFSIGPAILWSPFLIVAHLGVILSKALGGSTPADGYSSPYLTAMAFGTALYGFLALWISFQLGRKYISERNVFLATVGIWFGSSLPVYMYFNPSWSHAHSAFVVALFVYYWILSRHERTWGQWMILGALGGLMMDVYYLNAVLLLLPLFESLQGYRKAFKAASASHLVRRMLFSNAVFLLAVLIAFLPTLVTKKIVYGSYWNFGYTEHWSWASPAFLKVFFSADHGLFSWTPILVLAVAGLFLLLRYDRNLGIGAIAGFWGFAYAVGCYQDWDGISSFGNRFFISLTCIFVLGLAAIFDSATEAWRSHGAVIFVRSATTVLVFWNLGLIFQWGTHLIPARGPIYWRDAVHNQLAVVPVKAARTIESYFMHRAELMQDFERQDVNQLRSR